MKWNKLLIIGGSLILGCLLILASYYLLKETGLLKKQELVKELEIKSNPDGGYFISFRRKPVLIKGVSYNPTPIGKGYTYDFFSDENKPWMLDGELMKEMGINCVRVYSTSKNLDKVKEFISDMYQNFGIYTIVSDWLGLWDSPSANYADLDFQERTKKKVLEIVTALKDTEGLLMWNLGNENNYTFSGKIGFWTSPEIEKIETSYGKIMKKAEIYYAFVDELAKEIKAIDPIHPVALGNGEASFLDVASRVCENIDVLAIIIYRGKRFGNLFENIRKIFDKPIIVSEFGCDSYNAYTEKEDQNVQAEFLLSQWKDLHRNTVFGENTRGNCLGGVVFEWNDEWWKHNEGYSPDWDKHNHEAGWSNGSYYFDIRVPGNMNMNEEWFGLVSLSEKEKNNIHKRIPKKSYFILQEFFSEISSAKPAS
ncbi:MAG: hypothetical protein JSW17_00710 [Candidatus Omnitrophota bacterium]|nr:MAG: hypothetical protein JSW17_00710 [Candidatus Omnitrophota bacterium]